MRLAMRAISSAEAALKLGRTDATSAQEIQVAWSTTTNNMAIALAKVDTTTIRLLMIANSAIQDAVSVMAPLIPIV